jgi:hypothetical protein
MNLNTRRGLKKNHSETGKSPVTEWCGVDLPSLPFPTAVFRFSGANNPWSNAL